MLKGRNKLIYQIILWIVYIALLAVFVYLSLRTGEESTQDSNTVGNVVADVVDEVFDTEIVRDEQYFTLTRKMIGHYGYFVGIGLVSFLLYYSYDNIHFALRMGIHFSTGFIFAIISEFVLQASTEGRGPSFADALIDYGGFLTLSLILFIIFLVREIRKPKAV